MRCNFLSFTLLLFLLGMVPHAEAQGKRMFRIYEDNDVINVFTKATDKAYSNGTRFDYFYVPEKKLSGLGHALMPKAGEGSVNTLGWGVMQLMITPTHIERAVPEPGDYHYSGALFLVHTLHSANKRHKFNLQTEWIIGVMGPPALAKETQTWVHRVIGSQKPMGWDQQLPTDFLLNYNFAFEKNIFSYKQVFDFIGAAEAFAGTMLNGTTFSGTLRFGDLTPYFGGFVKQHTGDNKFRWFVLLKPGVEFIMYNALLEGGYFNEKSAKAAKSQEEENDQAINHFVSRLDFGMGASLNNWAVSFTQKSKSAMIKGLPHHSVGNITLSYAW